MSDDARPSYFRRIGDGVYSPTEHVGGAWDPDDQHMSPLGGLIVHEIERSRTGKPPMTIARVSFDILGRIVHDETTVTVRTLRPGRTIELVEAVATIAGRDTVAARAWLMADEQTEAIAGTDWRPLPAPDSLPARSIGEHWGGGYIRSVDIREALPYKPGRAAAWITTDVALVDDGPVGQLASFVMLIDTANGIAVRGHPQTLMFPNLDLTVHFFRQPVGEWVGLDTTVSFGPTGQGLTSSILHDLHGPVGTVEQILTVRPLTGDGGR